MLSSPSNLPGSPQPQLSAPSSEFLRCCLLSLTPLCCPSLMFQMHKSPLFHKTVNSLAFTGWCDGSCIPRSAKNVSALFTYRPLHACCPAGASTMHTEGLRRPFPAILILHGRINTGQLKNTYRSFWCVTNIKRFTAKCRFPIPLLHVLEQ